jgi:hypothetical protein
MKPKAEILPDESVSIDTEPDPVLDFTTKRKVYERLCAARGRMLEAAREVEIMANWIIKK